MIPLYGWIPEWPKGADCKSVAIASKVRILLRPLIRQAEMLVFFCYYFSAEGCKAAFNNRPLCG